MTQLGLTMPTPLVDITWLQEHLHHPDLTLLDCRFALSDPNHGRQAYEQEHLPGAHYLDLDLDLSGPVQIHGGRHPLPDLDQFITKLEALGIGSDPATAVVAYDATKGAFAARLWWLLRYLGHEAVAVLDGGFQAWQTAQLNLEKVIPPPPQPSKFSPQLQSDWLVDRVYVMERQETPGAVLVDARSPERFRGEQEPIDPIAGSIPGAANVFWQLNLDEQGYFKPSSELEQQWASVTPSEELIFYCGSGVTACINLLTQALLKHPIPKLYLGGWSDWCSYQ